MEVPNELHKVLSLNNGIFTTNQANETGISNEYLRLLVNSGKLNRIYFGIYSLPNELVDKMYIIQLRCKKIIYSHETALFLHDLTDRDPICYSITVPAGYNTTRLTKNGFETFFIKRELHELGINQIQTIFGNTVNVYNMERTICDCLRSRNRIDIAVITDALKRYSRRKEKNLNTLMNMAETFRVIKLLRNYMEVLL